MFRAVRIMLCDVYAFFFLKSTIKIQASERKREKAFIFQELLTQDSYFENFLNDQSSYGMKHVIVTFYLPHIFQYIPLKNVVNYICFKKK